MAIVNCECLKLVRLEVPIAVTVMNTVFWVVMLCSSLELCQHFGKALLMDSEFENLLSKAEQHIFPQVPHEVDYS
jgi:hypothetical protein